MNLFTPKSAKQKINGTDVYYMQWGNAQKELFLFHGTFVDNASLSWSELAPELATRFKIIAPDMPGYGKSSSTRSTPNLHSLEKFIESFIRSNAAKPVYAVAFGMNCSPLYDLAQRLPDLFEKICLIGWLPHSNTHDEDRVIRFFTRFPKATSLFLSLPSLKENIFRHFAKSVFFDSKNISEEFFAEYFREFRSKRSIDTFSKLIKNEFQHRGTYAKELQAHNEQVPTGYICGAFDYFNVSPLKPPPNLRHYFQIPNCGHWAPVEKPHETASIIGSFFEN